MFCFGYGIVGKGEAEMMIDSWRDARRWVEEGWEEEKC